MRLAAEHVIAGAPEDVFRALTDFEHYERLVAGRVRGLAREGDPATPEAGLGWSGWAELRGVEREVALSVAAAEAPRTLRLSGRFGGIATLYEVDLAPAGAASTRVATALSLRATSLKSRAVLMSLSVTRGGLEQRFDELAARMASDLAARVSAASDRPDRRPEA